MVPSNHNLKAPSEHSGFGGTAEQKDLGRLTPDGDLAELLEATRLAAT